MRKVEKERKKEKKEEGNQEGRKEGIEGWREEGRKTFRLKRVKFYLYLQMTLYCIQKFLRNP